MMELSRLTPHLARGWQIQTNAPKSIAITFDDGPDPDTTPWLLETLEQLKLQTTMFVIGKKCKGQATLLREMAAAGHAIACHGYVHSRHCFRGGEFLKASLLQTRYLLDEFGITMSPAFRPPYGLIDFTLHSRTLQTGFKPVLWSAHIGDWKPQSEESLLERTRAVFHERMILLLHDGHAATRKLKSTLWYLHDELQQRQWSAIVLPEAVTAVRVS